MADAEEGMIVVEEIAVIEVVEVIAVIEVDEVIAVIEVVEEIVVIEVVAVIAVEVEVIAITGTTTLGTRGSIFPLRLMTKQRVNSKMPSCKKTIRPSKHQKGSLARQDHYPKEEKEVIGNQPDLREMKMQQFFLMQRRQILPLLATSSNRISSHSQLRRKEKELSKIGANRKLSRRQRRRRRKS